MSGFPNKVIALQFEWQWQNSQRSRIIKNKKSVEKDRKGGYKVSLKVLHSLLRTPLWEKLNLKVHFLDNDKKKIFEKFFEEEKNDEENEVEGSDRGGRDFSSIKVNTQLNTASELEGMHLNRSDGTLYLVHDMFKLIAIFVWLSVSFCFIIHQCIFPAILSFNNIFICLLVSLNPPSLLEPFKAISNSGECTICRSVLCVAAGPIERENGRESEQGREKEKVGPSRHISNTQGSELILEGRGEGKGSEGSESGLGVGRDPRDRMWVCPRPGCGSGSHVYCMAVKHFKDQEQRRGEGGRCGKGEAERGGEQIAISLVPDRGVCCSCGESVLWIDVITAVCVEQREVEEENEKRSDKERVKEGKVRVKEGRKAERMAEKSKSQSHKKAKSSSSSSSSQRVQCGGSDDDSSEASEDNGEGEGEGDYSSDDVFVSTASRAATSSRTHQHRGSRKGDSDVRHAEKITKRGSERGSRHGTARAVTGSRHNAVVLCSDSDSQGEGEGEGAGCGDESDAEEEGEGEREIMFIDDTSDDDDDDDVFIMD